MKYRVAKIGEAGIKILLALYGKTLNVTGIIREANISPSTFYTKIEILVDLGLVECVEDGRIKMYSLTDNGHKLARELYDIELRIFRKEK